MIKGYKSLEIYQKAYELALVVHKATERVKDLEIKSQLRRSSKSVAVNIAEGYGRKYAVADFKRFLYMSLSSCDETRVWLDFCSDLEILDHERCKELTTRYEVLGKQINQTIKVWK